MVQGTEMAAQMPIVTVEMVQSVWGPRSTLKIQPMEFVDGLAVGCERKKSQDDLKVWPGQLS